MKRAKTKAKDVMTNRDIIAASSALVDWLQSQDIPVEDAPRVLTVVLVGLIASLAIRYRRDPKVGGRVIAKMISEAFDDV